MELKKDFWKGKKVFITGHTGFKGSWLTLWLKQWEAEVTGFSLAPATKPSLFELAYVQEGINHQIGDIQNLKLLQDSISKAKPEIIFHMAAQALVLPSYENPVETYMTNVMGTVHLLEAIRHCPSVKAAVIVTSDKCYENKEWIWPYRENEPMGGHDPYSNSKGCAELVTSSYRNSFFSDKKSSVQIATARAGNVIGGGDWSAYRLIPDILNSLSQNQSIELRNPLAVRPWQHVLEPLNGYMLLAQKLFHSKDFADAWNFGPGPENHHSVEWIANKLCSFWGKSSEQLIQKAPPQGHEAHLLQLDSSKARLQLGWKPRWSLEQTLQTIVSWQTCFLEKGDLRSISLQQIESYLKDSAS